jgi:hypothetical protein
MNRLGLAVLGTLIGLVVGIVIGRVFFTEKTAKPVLPEVQHYYYRLSDSTVARHTISVTDSGLSHIIDTLAVGQR